MAGTEQRELDPNNPYDGIDWDVLGQYGEATYIDPALVTREPTTLSDYIATHQPKARRGAFTNFLTDQTGFEDQHEHWKIARDVLGMVRHVEEGLVERYPQKLARLARKTGLKETAAVGPIKIGKNDVTLFTLRWPFYAGSLGVVAGEKHQVAVRDAIENDTPLVASIASSGARQEENNLAELYRIINDQLNYRRNSPHPYTVVFDGDVWGGSSVIWSQADVIAAMAGTHFGFSGGRVIEGFQGKPPREGLQTAEANLVTRNIHVLYQTPLIGMEHLDRLFSASKLDLDEELRLDNLRKIAGGGNVAVRKLRTREKGYLSPLETGTVLEFEDTESPPKERVVFPKDKNKKKDALYKLYQEVKSDSSRPDVEFFLYTCFDEVAQLYSGSFYNGIQKNPSIIAAIGKIGPQPFLVVGNQASYQETSDGSIKKISPIPGPNDYRYLVKYLQYAAAKGLPVVSFVDTLGALPTEQAEEAGISSAIGQATAAGIENPGINMAFTIGGFGSGGGVGSAPFGELFAMTSDSLFMVAEARSATAIITGKPNPTIQQIKDTLFGMKPTAHDQNRFGIVNKVVTAYSNPYITADKIRGAIVETFLAQQQVTVDERLTTRHDRISNLRSFKVKK